MSNVHLPGDAFAASTQVEKWLESDVVQQWAKSDRAPIKCVQSRTVRNLTLVHRAGTAP